MGYATNQFENFAGYEGATKDLKRTADDNPNFIWPSNRLPDVYNPISRNPNSRYTVDTLMQRGFIRGIYPSVLGGLSNPSAAKVKQRRLFFQFNPATIDRSVSMNTETALPLLQDPSQLFQPINGNAQFSFELLFDRQAEVVTSTYRNEDNTVVSGATLSGPLDNYGANWQQSNVSDLGVLADLYVLDSIIGQSITPDMTSFLKDYWNYVGSVTNYDTDMEGASASNSETQQAFDATKFESSVKNNYGNSAFLSPLPIRIVFSSLFMVEGFVTASSVQFTKFTKNYVPTVCRVALDVKALYIGFAREKSYLTDTLSAAIADQVAEKDATRAAIQASTTLTKDAVRFKYTLGQASKPKADQSGRLYDSSYNTFKEFFDAESLQGYLTFQGISESWVFKALSDEVKNGSSWNFSSAFQVFEYSSSIPSNNLPTENGLYGQKIFQSYIDFSKVGYDPLDTGFKVNKDEVVNTSNKTNDSLNPSKYVWLANGSPSVKTIGADSLIVFKIVHSVTSVMNVQGTRMQLQPINPEDVFKITANSSSDWTSWKNRTPTWFLPKTTYTGNYQ